MDLLETIFRQCLHLDMFGVLIYKRHLSNEVAWGHSLKRLGYELKKQSLIAKQRMGNNQGRTL